MHAGHETVLDLRTGAMFADEPRWSVVPGLSPTRPLFAPPSSPVAHGSPFWPILSLHGDTDGLDNFICASLSYTRLLPLLRIDKTSGGTSARAVSLVCFCCEMLDGHYDLGFPRCDGSLILGTDTGGGGQCRVLGCHALIAARPEHAQLPRPRLVRESTLRNSLR